MAYPKLFFYYFLYIPLLLTVLKRTLEKYCIHKGKSANMVAFSRIDCHFEYQSSSPILLFDDKINEASTLSSCLKWQKPFNFKLS